MPNNITNNRITKLQASQERVSIFGCFVHRPMMFKHSKLEHQSWNTQTIFGMLICRRSFWSKLVRKTLVITAARLFIYDLIVFYTWKAITSNFFAKIFWLQLKKIHSIKLENLNGCCWLSASKQTKTHSICTKKLNMKHLISIRLKGTIFDYVQ